MTENKIIQGELTYVAKTGGIKINGTDKWINASPGVKKLFADGDLTIEAVKKKLLNKEVNIELDAQGFWNSIWIPEEVEAQLEDIEETESNKETTQSITEGTQSALPKDKPLEKVYKAEFKKPENKETEDNYFTKLNKVRLEVSKKLNLNYVSWADAWKALKEIHPEAVYFVHESKEESPLFRAGTGGVVKVSVAIKPEDSSESYITNTVTLPVMGLKNEGVIYNEITSMQVNKSIQRALVKAIAMHGLGIYVFQGENNPEED